jgi:hypothetical protein
MKKQFLSVLLILNYAPLTPRALAQDHGHLNMGAVGTSQNDQLTFDNGGDFASNAGYVKTLDFAATGTYAGYFQGNITFTVLAATPEHLGPVPNAPALGSRMFAQLVSVDGPSGGAFGFWDTGAIVPTISLTSGATGTNVFRISENDGSPGTDPYGHIHGRRFTTTKPGIYTVGFRAFDFSANGVGGGPIHMPSALLKVCFQAGVNIKSIETQGTRTDVTFGAKAGFLWQLEAANSLPAGTNWQSIGAPLLGDDYFHKVPDDQAVNAVRFYRVNGTLFVP